MGQREIDKLEIFLDLFTFTELTKQLADFAHLNNVFLDVRFINIDDLKQYF